MRFETIVIILELEFEFDKGGYIVALAGLSEDWKSVCVIVIVGIIIIIRLFNFDFLVKFSTLFSIFSIIPAILYIGFAIPHIDPFLWSDAYGESNCTLAPNSTHEHTFKYSSCDDNPVQVGVLGPWLLWMWSGKF